MSFLASKEMVEGKFRRQKEQNEVRFNLGGRADWRRGGLRLHVRIAASGIYVLSQLLLK